MLEFASIPGSDDWWLVRLAEKLGQGLPRMAKLTAYRDGDALLPDNAWDTGTRESYLRFMKRSRLHVVETIRDARTDRQRVLGFRTAAAGDENGDLAAWAHWKRNRMGIQSRKFFNDTGDYGRAYTLLVPSPNGPIWNVRNEWNTITEANSLRPWLAEAGITYGYDDVHKAESLTLYRPGYFRRAYRPSLFSTLPQDGTPWYAGPGWTWREDPQMTPWTEDSLLQQNRTVDGFGVYEKHLDTIDRINEITLNALTLIVMQSFRQRGVKGNLPEKYPEGHPQAGQEIDYDELFKAGPAALWMLPMGADIWESTPTDVTPIYNARREELKTLMSNTRTPQDLFDGDSNNQSAKGADISREPLVHAVNDMNDQAEVRLVHTMAQTFLMEGDKVRSDENQIEVIWAKPQPTPLLEKAEASAKAKAGGLTQALIDEEIFELTPAQRRQAEQDRIDEAFTAAIAGGVTPTARPVTSTDENRG